MGWLNRLTSMGLRRGCKGRFSSIAIPTGLAVVLALAGAARGTEVVAVRPPASDAWNLQVGGSYVSTSDFGGWGIALRGGWLANPHLVVGLGIETARLHAEGLTSGGFGPAQPYSLTFQSTFPAAFVRGQLPFRFLTPYAELAAGLVVVHSQREENTQCSYGSGPGAGFAIGVDAPISPSISAGVRADVRNIGWGGGCLAEGGPWSFNLQNDFRMTSLALTTGFRW
jgi:hypothetical protein